MSSGSIGIKNPFSVDGVCDVSDAVIRADKELLGSGSCGIVTTVVCEDEESLEGGVNFEAISGGSGTSAAS